MMNIAITLDRLEAGGIRATCSTDGHESQTFDSPDFRTIDCFNDSDKHAYLSGREYADSIGMNGRDCFKWTPKGDRKWLFAV